jgi:hypothetical protein
MPCGGTPVPLIDSGPDEPFTPVVGAAALGGWVLSRSLHSGPFVWFVTARKVHLVLLVKRKNTLQINGLCELMEVGTAIAKS